MKRLIALVLAGLMVLGGGCLAAQWPEGRSAAQPYSHLPEVNLSETMGYIMLFPRAKLPVTRFCDVLGMYLPREDLKLGEGVLHLYEKTEDAEPVEVCTVDFADPDSVVMRDMTEKELSDLMWGGGTCVEMYLPKSLEFGDREHVYYVLMDEGCYTAADGRLSSLQITSEEAWMPVISGDYGVSGLYYTDAELPSGEEEAVVEEDDEELIGENGITDVPVEADAEDGEEKDEKSDGKTDASEASDASEKPETSEEPDAEATTEAGAAPDGEDGDEAEEPVEYVTKPDVGDRVHFDLVLGGDATLAVMYSDNGSVEFDEIEFTQSGPVEGTVLGEDVQWGVAFYDANDYIFDTIDVYGR